MPAEILPRSFRMILISRLIFRRAYFRSPLARDSFRQSWRRQNETEGKKRVNGAKETKNGKRRRRRMAREEGGEYKERRGKDRRKVGCLNAAAKGRFLAS